MAPLTRWLLDTRPLWRTEEELRQYLSFVPQHDLHRVLSKKLLPDKKLALASLLMQRHYIHIMTGTKREAIEITRTPHGQPAHPDVSYSVSRSDGIVILVGYRQPVGADIVRSDTVSQTLSLDLSSIFSSRELSQWEGSGNVSEGYSVGWALKEAYMKFTGIPKWDDITTFEFLDMEVPTASGTLVTSINPSVYIGGVREDCYTECHNFEDTHFIVLYTKDPPTAASSKNMEFRKLSLEEITPT